LTPESAPRLVALKADPERQVRVDDLAPRGTFGTMIADIRRADSMVFNNEGQESAVLLGNPEMAKKRAPVATPIAEMMA
jgi:hypothetical protein